ncbi:hypothetical protein IX51_02240 [uncultured archaeon]|nr:hypothetical protein IX51_02240 [uncultured archaeon]
MSDTPPITVIDSQEKLKKHFVSIPKSGSWLKGINSSQIEETASRIVKWSPGSRNNIFLVKSHESRYREATAFLILSKLISGGKRVLIPTAKAENLDEKGLFGNGDVLFLNAAESNTGNGLRWEDQSRLLGDIWTGRASDKLLNIPIVALSDLDGEEKQETKIPPYVEGHMAPSRSDWRITLSVGFILFAAEFLLMAIANGIKGGLGIAGIGYRQYYSNQFMNFLVYGQVETSPYNFLLIYPWFTIIGLALILISRKFVDRRTYRLFIYATVLWVVGTIGVTLAFNFTFFGPFSGNVFSRTVPALIYEIGINSSQSVFVSLTYALLIVRFAKYRQKIILMIVSAGYVAVTALQSSVVAFNGPGAVIRPGYATMPSVYQIISYVLFTFLFTAYFVLFLKLDLYSSKNQGNLVIRD